MFAYNDIGYFIDVVKLWVSVDRDVSIKSFGLLVLVVMVIF